MAAGNVEQHTPHRDARPDRRRRPRPRHRRPRPGHRRDHDALRRRRRPRHRRLRQRLLPVDQRQGLQRHRDLAGAQARRLLRQPLLHADPPDLHPGQRRLPVEADADERVAAQRRPGVGAQGRAATTRDPRQIPEDERDYYLERIYPAFGNLVPRDIASRPGEEHLRRGSRRRPRRARRLPRLRRRDRRGWAARRSRPSTATSSTCTSRSPARTPTRCRCGSTRRCTTRWAGCGSTTTCSPRSPGCS